MIRNLWFDMGGVVFRQDSEEAFLRFRAAGIDPERYMGAYGQKEFFLDLESGRIDREEFCRRMARAAGREEVELDQARHCWLGFVRDVPTERLRHLLELRREYRLCLLSNTNPFAMEFARSDRFSTDGRPITDYFDRLFCSYEMGICKPDPEFFRRVLAAEGVRAEETVFVDDSLKNVRAAEEVGIRGLHVETNAEWWGPLTELLQESEL